MRQLTKILIAISLIFSLSACGYGSVPETAKMGPAGNGADVVLGDLKIQEVLVINDGTNAVVTAVIINTGDVAESLLGVGVGQKLATLVDTTSGVATKVDEIAIPAKTSVSLSFSAPYGAILNNTEESIPSVGSIVKLTFGFSASGFKNVEAITFANDDYYSTINPSAFALSN